jgi:hypothetical protein
MFFFPPNFFKQPHHTTTTPQKKKQGTDRSQGEESGEGYLQGFEQKVSAFCMRDDEEAFFRPMAAAGTQRVVSHLEWDISKVDE